MGKNKTKKSGPYVSETVNLMRVTGDDKATNSSSPGLMETHSFYPFYYERLLRYRHTARPTSTNTHFYGSLVSFCGAERIRTKHSTNGINKQQLSPRDVIISFHRKRLAV